MISDGSEDRFAFIHDALAAAQAVAVAERLGVFTRLVDGPADPSILARDCAISTRGAAALLAALTGIGLVEATGNGTYQISKQPFPLAELRAHWRELESVVRTGEPRFAGDAPEEAGANYPRIVPRLGSLFAPAAERFAKEVAAPGLRVLDLGCGRASSSIFLCREFGVQVWAADLWFSASENSSASETRELRTVCSRSMRMPARCRLPQSSSIPLCALMPFLILERTTSI